MVSRFSIGMLLSWIAVDGLWSQDRELAESPRDWRALTQHAAELFARGEVDNSVMEFREALATAEALQPRDDEAIMHCQLALSSALLQAGQFDEGRRLALDANQIAEQRLKAAQGQVATTLKYLGTMHMLRGEAPEAQAALQRAVELARAAHGDVHPETAKHLGNLASVQMQLKEFDAARETFRQCLAIWEQVAEPHPIYHSGALANFGALQLQLDETEAGLASFEQGLQILEKSLGASDPRLHQYLRRYAQVLESAGQASRAQALRERFPANSDSCDGK